MMEQFNPEQPEVKNKLEEMADNVKASFDNINDPVDNPYASGFDEEHPVPTYDQLRNAGFTDYEAKLITSHTYSTYSEKELFEVLYSENPKEAYDAMMRQKLDELDKKIARTITGGF